MQEQMLKSPSTASLNFPDKIIFHKLDEKSGAANRTKVSTTAISYSVASLQVATNSFNQDCLVGEGSLGRVYRAEFPNGKVIFCELHHVVKSFSFILETKMCLKEKIKSSIVVI